MQGGGGEGMLDMPDYKTTAKNNFPIRTRTLTFTQVNDTVCGPLAHWELPRTLCPSHCGF